MSDESPKPISTVEEENDVHIDDLLQPRYYPDPVIFRDSLDDLKRYDEELRNNIRTNQTTLNVLAPYLKTVYKDQKKALVESAKNLKFSAKAKEAKLLLCEEKTKDTVSTAQVDITEQYEMIVSIHETADVLKSLVKAKTVVSYLVNPTKNEIYQSPRYVLSSMDTLAWKLEAGTTMAAHAAATKRYVVSDNILADTRFSLGLGFAGTMAKYAICIPIKTADDKVVAVYELTRDVYSNGFDPKDIQVMLTVVGWMGFAIQYNMVCTSLMRRLELSDYLVQVTHHFHGGHASLYETLSDIVMFARQTMAAERANFYLVERGTEDTFIIEEYNQDAEDKSSLFKRRRKTNVVRDDGSYLSQVIFAKEIVNKYETQVEISSNSDRIKLRSIVCVPIICKCEQVIGVIQLTNKKTATQFDKDDEEILQTFALFFAICLNRNIVQETANKYLLQKNVNREMLLYQLTPCIHDIEAMKKSLEGLPNNFSAITWFPSQDIKALLPQLTLELFSDVLGDNFMSSNDMCNFILTVRNCYRSNPYHNFTHAVNATHKMATILKNYNSLFSYAERQGLMIAILCHDVDHQSYTNSFIKLTDHYLSKLYESSPIENHHFAVTKIILEKYGILRYLKPEAYKKVLVEIFECILSTDLSQYFQNKIKLLQLADQGLLNLKENHHRRLIKHLMMISCDLSDQAIPNQECRKLNDDLYEEFFYQGDLLRKKGLIPMPTMDRQQKDMIPENQIQFLMVVLLPCLETLAQIFDIVLPLVSNCKDVIRQLRQLVEVKDQETWKPEESIPTFKLTLL